MTKRLYLSPPHMGGAEMQYIQQAFDTNWIAPLGPCVNQFEDMLSKTAGREGCVALSSGTAAIHLALRYLGVGEGDFVLCSSFTFSGSCNPVVYEKAVPVFVDSEPDSWNMSPTALKKAMGWVMQQNKLPKAVIIVDLYGQSADYDALLEICGAYGVPVIEDAAEALGATYREKPCGTFGQFGIYSFNGNKIITTSGGGAVMSDNVEALEKIKFWATQSRDKAPWYQHTEIGFNYRLSNICAAIGCGQMQVLQSHIEHKKDVFETYQKAFENAQEIDMMPIADFGEPNYWLSVIRLTDTAKVTPLDIINALEEHNIEARPVWKPMHMQPVFQDSPFFSHLEEGSVCEELFERGVCLPSGSSMQEKEQQQVIDTILNIL